MRLQRATTVNRRIEGDDELGLTREERQERRQRRRARRRARREARREARLERKAEKLRARADKLDEKAGRGTRRERRAQRRAGNQGYPQDQGYPPDQAAYPDGWTPSSYPDDGSLPDDDAPPMEPGEVDLEPAPDGTEGLGWSWPRLRRGRRAAAPVAPVTPALPAPAIPADLPAAIRRGAAPRGPQLPALWSPPARMGSHMRIQASSGYRAAVVELKPGLFVVAEIPAQVAASEMGFGAVLTPLLIRAASRAAARREAQAQPIQYVQQPDGTFVPATPQAQPERRGFLSLFQRRGAQPAAQPVAALPGPVAEPVAGPLVVAVPRVAAWADPVDVAGVLAGPFAGRR